MLITIIPSIIFGYDLVRKERFSESSNRYLQEISILSGSYLIEAKVDPNQSSISLLYSGYGPNEEELVQIKEKALIFQLDTSKISIIEGADAEILKQSASRYLTEAQELENKLNITTSSLKKSPMETGQYTKHTWDGRKPFKGDQANIPTDEELLLCRVGYFTDTTRSERIPIVVFTSKRN